MVFRYPNGHPVVYDGAAKQKLQEKSKINFANRGMRFEEAINLSNEYYLNHKKTVVHKKPTPIQIVQVDYPRRSAAVIKEAYFKEASTTDYNGVYQGYYLDFEAKETKNKTSFPLANLPEHQRTHMLQCIEQGGIAFLILSFAAHNETYIIPYEKVDSEIKKSKKQSLTYEFIKQEGFLCKEGLFPIIDYLAALDQYIESRE